MSPATIKLAKKEILVGFKKEDPDSKANYQPISLLPIISKIFERVLFGQIEKFAEKVLSQKLCGFRKGHSTQHSLLNLLKNWEKTLVL